jgi:hypothetical protein
MEAINRHIENLNPANDSGKSLNETDSMIIEEKKLADENHEILTKLITEMDDKINEGTKTYEKYQGYLTKFVKVENDRVTIKTNLKSIIDNLSTYRRCMESIVNTGKLPKDYTDNMRFYEYESTYMSIDDVCFLLNSDDSNLFKGLQQSVDICKTFEEKFKKQIKHHEFHYDDEDYVSPESDKDILYGWEKLSGSYRNIYTELAREIDILIRQIFPALGYAYDMNDLYGIGIDASIKVEDINETFERRKSNI